MANFMMFKQLLYYTIVIGSLPVVADTLERSTGLLPEIIVICMMLSLIMPECFLFHPGYRKWIQGALEDHDGEFNKEDIRYFVSWYGPFLCLRLLIFNDLFHKLAPWYEPNNTLIWCLVGVATGTALPQIQKLFGK